MGGYSTSKDQGGYDVSGVLIAKSVENKLKLTLLLNSILVTFLIWGFDRLLLCGVGTYGH